MKAGIRDMFERELELRLHFQRGKQQGGIAVGGLKRTLQILYSIYGFSNVIEVVS